MPSPVLDPAYLRTIVEAALAEDAVWADVTTAALFRAEHTTTADLVAEQDGVVAGLGVVAAALEIVDTSLQFKPRVWDGQSVQFEEEIASISGPTASLLRVERVLLNFLEHLSGIATATARAVEVVADLPIRIVDSWRTTPGLRPLERHAIQAGGGHGHRSGLADGVLITQNHLAALRAGGLGIPEAVSAARSRSPHTLRVEVEVINVLQAIEALVGGADILLLSGMSVEEMREVVARCRGRALTEAGPGVTLDTLRPVAEAGVDLIALDTLTTADRLRVRLELQSEVEHDA